MLKYFIYFLDTLVGCVFIVLAYTSKPHALALKRYRIRIVAVTDDKQQKEWWRDEAYKALMLLEQYDNETFERVTKHVRIILPFQKNHKMPVGQLYLLSVQSIPTKFSEGTLPITIAGNLAAQATLANIKSRLFLFDKSKKAWVKEQCRKEQQRTIHKLEQAICES